MLITTRLLCLLALGLVLAEARYHGRRRDPEDDEEVAYPSLAEQEMELELPRPGHRRHRSRHSNEEDEVLKFRDAETTDLEENDDYEELRRPTRQHRLPGPRRSFRGWSRRELEEASDSREALRGKRHNRRRPWTEQNKRSFNRSRSRPQYLENDSAYEVEVHEAQNSSLCNYTVIPIPDPGGRMPRDLEHVRCNHVGSRCQDKGAYCCIQTYRNVEVMYEGGSKETIKVYSGCVCSLLIYGTLNPYTPDLDLDD